METTPVLPRIIAIVATIITSASLISLAHYFGWLGNLFIDVLLSIVVSLLVIYSYPPALELPLWLRLLFSFVMFVWLQVVERHLPEMSLPRASFDDEFFHLSHLDQEIDMLFEFEEVE